MSANEIRNGDVGTVFTLTVNNGVSAEDISTATVKKFVFLKPSGKRMIKDAEFVTDGSDGQLKYTTASTNDLDEAGDWQLQAYVNMPSWEGKSDIFEFEVHHNL